jgi:competence protein ComEC
MLPALNDAANLVDAASFAGRWASAAALLLGWWIVRRRQFDRAAAWLLLAAVGLTGAAWHDLRWNFFGDGEIGRFAAYDPQPACVECVAYESPERMSAPPPTPLRAIPGVERSRLRVQLAAIRDGTTWRRATGVCELLINGHLLGIHAGDRLRVFGQLGRPAPPLNHGEFDFAAHARADGHLARLRSSAPECISLLESGNRWTPTSILDSARSASRQLVQELVGPDRAALAAAILLGARQGLQYDQTEPYLVTGTIHVLVVSGMNVAILAAGLLGIMRMGWVGRRAGLASIIALVILYALLAEVQPPVVRAAVMGVVLCLAAWTGRRGVAFNALAAAALFVLAINPADLFRAGPQLSFLAVATLVWFGSWAVARRHASIDRLDQLVATARPWYIRTLTIFGRWIGWLLFASLAVWLAALPLVLMHFHVASPVSVLISPAVWLFVVIAMWSGLGMFTVGWLIPPLGALFGSLCNASLGGLESLVAWAEALPGSHMWAPGPACWWVLVFYIGLLSAMLWGRALAPPRWQVAALCAWVLVGLVPPFVRELSRGDLLCSFVAVGHGTCVVLETPTGETLLYDAGALGAPEFVTQSIAAYLWHRGIMRIDGIVISHADVDHYNAVPRLLDRFDVGAVYVSTVMFDGFGEASARGGPQLLHAAIRDAEVPLHKISAGDRLRVGRHVTIDVLHPPRNGVLGNDNANSLTLAVEYRGRRVLLPGDLESPGLDDLVAERPYDCDVLLAPHHGSRQSDPPGFAAWSTPEWVVISGGGSDVVRPVAETYRLAGAQVFSTHARGGVQILIEPHKIHVATMPSADSLHRVSP